MNEEKGEESYLLTAIEHLRSMPRIATLH